MAKYILAAGGILYSNTTENSEYTDAVDIFKVTADSVEKVEDHGLKLSVARYSFAISSAGQYILVMGGCSGPTTDHDTVDIFKVTADGVEKIENHGLKLSSERACLSAASCGNYILAMGGAYTDIVEVFKVTADGVEKIEDHGLKLSTPRGFLAGTSCGQYVFAMGGYKGEDLDTVDIFKVTADGVEKIENHGLKLSVGRQDLAAVSCDNYVLAMGGYILGGTSSDTVDVFKITDTGFEIVKNHKLKLSSPCSRLVAASAGNYVLATSENSDVVDVFKVIDGSIIPITKHNLKLSGRSYWGATASCDNYILSLGGVIAGNAVDVFEVID